VVYYKSHIGCPNPAISDKSGRRVGRFHVVYIREITPKGKRWRKVGWICIDCNGFIPLNAPEARILEAGQKRKKWMGEEELFTLSQSS